ncbi:MAG: hypothetical protein AAGH78_08955, partial [Cyanobacteria bacterium P01_H01_bin.58]
MVDSNSAPADRYFDLIDRVVKLTLKGQIRSKAQVYRLLQAEMEPGEGETFAHCLQERTQAVETLLQNEADELKQAKATRQQRALKTLQGEFEHWQKENQSTAVLSGTLASLMQTADQERLSVLLQALDQNQASR